MPLALLRRMKLCTEGTDLARKRGDIDAPKERRLKLANGMATGNGAAKSDLNAEQDFGGF